MSAPGATQGPWKVGNGDVYAEGDASSQFDDRVICAIGRSGGFRSHEYAIVKAHKPEGIANAHLIAASPALYDALEAITDSLVSTVEEFGCWTAEEHPKVAAARAALALARGEAA